MRAVHGEATDWRLEHHLLALLVDATAVGNWQRGNAGRKSPSRRPSPLPRPGVTRHAIGRTSLSREEVKAFLARFNPPEEVAADDD